MNKNDFAKYPPMGWNSWDCYGAAVTEKELRQNADYMAEHLKEHGWEYVICDIQGMSRQPIRAIITISRICAWMSMDG